jgi:hypothetical protein
MILLLSERTSLGGACQTVSNSEIFVRDANGKKTFKKSKIFLEAEDRRDDIKSASARRGKAVRASAVIFGKNERIYPAMFV